MSEITTTGGAAPFDISDYMTDAKAETQGVWRILGKDKAGNVREACLARIGNDEYSSLLRKKQRANQALLEQNDDEAFSLAKQIQREVMAATIIKGLRVNGVAVAYTYEIGINLLKSSADFQEKIFNMANQADAYRMHEEAETAKS